jgi:hypothetical protein
VKKAKRKRKSEPELDAKTKAVIENAIRIRTRMRVRDLSGQPKLFRSTVAKDPESVEDEENETEGDGG